MISEEVRKYMAKIGKKGGENSKRKLTSEQARAMVKAREKKKREKETVDNTKDVK